jgi:hypothetical protein
VGSGRIVADSDITQFFEFSLGLCSHGCVAMHSSQAMELSIDGRSMAIEIRPRATDTQVELDAFVACQVSGIIEVERTAMAQLTRQKDRPTTPFDPGSYSDVLKLIGGNLDSEGQYTEVLNQDGTAPPAGEHLVVTDAWVLLSRPRTINNLFEDLMNNRALYWGG